MRYVDGSERPLEIEMIRAAQPGRGEEFLKANMLEPPAPPKPEPAPTLLDIKPADQWMTWMRRQPVPKKLFGSFWQEDELCILFADTNMGKSILAVQLAESIASGQPIAGFELERKPGGVLYIDFELSTKQFEMRYTGTNKQRYRFHKNFYRAEVLLEAQKPKGYATYVDYMAYNIHTAVKDTGARIIIVDNITCMGGNIGQAGSAVNMMKALKMLKTRHWLSILVLAHTPKGKAGKPLTRNDLGGSKMLMNFADSAIAMGDSARLPGHRYLKQVKQRAGTQQYGADNVSLLKLVKTNGFLHFTHAGQSAEQPHLSTRPDTDRPQQIARALELSGQGYSQRQIAREMELGLATVNGLLKEGKVSVAEAVVA